MQMMSRMNSKMIEGWKITNACCQICNNTLMAKPNEIHQVYCPKCNMVKPYKSIDSFEQNDQCSKISSQQTKSHKEIHNNIMSSNQAFMKTNQVSKKMGQKLLQGWCMLQQGCLNCNVPLMKSKNGQKICYGCNKDYAKIQQIIIEQKQNIKYNEQNQKKIQKDKEIIEQKIEQNNIQIIIIKNMKYKCLKFIDKRLNESIQNNNLFQIEHLINLIQKLNNFNIIK